MRYNVVSMRLLLALVTAALVPGSLAFAAGKEPPAGARTCGDVHLTMLHGGKRTPVNVGSIRNVKVSCRKAREVARAWGLATRLPDAPARRAAGYRCRYEAVAPSVGNGTCRG